MYEQGRGYRRVGQMEITGRNQQDGGVYIQVWYMQVRLARVQCECAMHG